MEIQINRGGPLILRRNNDIHWALKLRTVAKEKVMLCLAKKSESVAWMETGRVKCHSVAMVETFTN